MTCTTIFLKHDKHKFINNKGNFSTQIFTRFLKFAMAENQTFSPPSLSLIFLSLCYLQVYLQKGVPENFLLEASETKMRNDHQRVFHLHFYGSRLRYKLGFGWG